MATGLHILCRMKLVLLTAILFSLPTSATQREPTIISFSASAQGNGYNWASTLGWLSEQLMMTAEEARALEARDGRKVLIDITSIGGGSSASAATLVLDAALNNPTLVSRNEPQQDAEHIERLAHMVRFIALASDYDLPIVASTAVRRAVQKVKTRYLHHPDSLWISQLSSTVVVSDYGRMIHIARTLDWSMINGDIQEQPGYNSALPPSASSAVKKALADVHKLYDLTGEPAQQSDARLATQTHYALKQFANWRKHAIKQIIDRELRKQVGTWDDIFRRWGEGMTPPEPMNLERASPFQKTLGEEIHPGFFTITMAAPFSSITEMQTAVKNRQIDYSDARAYIIMNAESAATILGSEFYRHEVAKPESYLRRYVIAVVDQRWPALNISIREPGLVEELSGSINSPAFRIRALYDPTSGQAQNYNLRTTNTDDVLFVFGGFPYPEMTALVQTIFHCEHSKTLRNENIKVLSRFHIFGKPYQINENKTFATLQITTTFNTRGEVGAKENLSDWYAWITEFFQMWQPQLQENSGELIDTRMNWDLGTIPGAMAGLAETLVAKGTIAARTAPRNFKSQRPLPYDPEPSVTGR